MEDTTFPKVNTAAVAAALGAMICLVFAPADAIESARYGLSLCAELIVPSLLPFFAASALLIRLQIPALFGKLLAPLSEKLWGVSGVGASAFLAGICAGYPLGAQTVAEMAAEKQLTKEEAERLLAFCNNSGPSFCIGVIGSGVFVSRRAGIVLYAIHVLSALLVGILFRGKAICSEPIKGIPEPRFSSALVGAIRQAVSAVLSVCGFVVCFCVLTGLLESLGVLGAVSRVAASLFGADERVLHAFLTYARSFTLAGSLLSCSLSDRLGRTLRFLSNRRRSEREQSFAALSSDRPNAERYFFRDPRLSCRPIAFPVRLNEISFAMALEFFD